MLCQNCGKNEANIQYTQIINGVKKEIRLCDKCAKELGVDSLEFNMPINFANFLGDFLGDYTSNMLPDFISDNNKKCQNCGQSYEDFIRTGLMGCPECYNTFADRLDLVLKKLQGSSKYLGRKVNSEAKKIKIDEKENKTEENNNIENEEKNKLEELNEKLKQAIKDERYEDAAKLRDEIKKLNK